MSRETLSLIICTYCRPQAVATLLAALRTQTRLPETILVVDASPDAATAVVVRAAAQTWPAAGGLRYLLAPAAQRGLTRQRNYGIAHAPGSIIAFLDDDTVPEPTYFAKLLACFAAHPDAAGVGGLITNEVAWRAGTSAVAATLGTFRYNGWERREDYRWRVRRLVGLAGGSPPGWLPRHGHGRSLGFLPPDGATYRVEFLMGCAAAWRRTVFTQHAFSHYFAGYGLYEDLDFSVRVSRHQPLYFCTRARLAHYHAAGGRPQAFRYGVMVVRNGWYVWRQRWPRPAVADGLRWWAISLLLTGCRLGDAVRGPQRRQAVAETLGRLWGMIGLAARKPRPMGSRPPAPPQLVEVA